MDPQKQDKIAVHLPMLQTLRGKVVDTQEHPIAGAQIYATRRPETPEAHGAHLASTQTDETGDFQMKVLASEPQFLSIRVSKSSYFSRVYENVDTGKMPAIIQLEKGVTVEGHVILPQGLPSDAQYAVKVFRADADMKPSLNPLALQKPILAKYFPVTESTFTIDGLFAERYTLYIVGDGISATSVDVDASASPKGVHVLADRPTTTVRGQVRWADTDAPVPNAVVSRSWYPWELHPQDMSMTLDRFAVETDAHGNFEFGNLTDARYQLHIRAVHAVHDDATERYQRRFIHKQIEVPTADTTYRIYLGKRDGTPFTTQAR